MSSFELHICVKHPMTAPELLKANCDLSISQLKQAMHKGAVWLTSGKKTTRLRRTTRELLPEQTLHFYFNQSALSDDFKPAKLIEDCGEYSLWYKPCGMMSQGSKWGDHSTIARFSEIQLTPQRPSFIVHRLDRATHGVMLIAHSKRAARALSLLFEQRQISKKYQAVVTGEFTGSQTYTNNIDGKTAHTTVRGIKFDPSLQASLVDVAIGSGRKHQIRRHLSEAAWPIVGDRLYGEKVPDMPDLQLCAYYLAFDCPLTGNRKEIRVATQLLIS